MNEKTVAIVGASSDPSKFGYKAVRAYRRQGWTVYPVSPKGGAIDGLPVYRTIGETPGPIRRVSMYVPPAVGRTLLADIKAKAPEELFFNPGSESDELVEEAKAIGLDPIVACSIVDIGERP